VVSFLAVGNVGLPRQSHTHASSELVCPRRFPGRSRGYPGYDLRSVLATPQRLAWFEWAVLTLAVREHDKDPRTLGREATSSNVLVEEVAPERPCGVDVGFCEPELGYIGNQSPLPGREQMPVEVVHGHQEVREIEPAFVGGAGPVSVVEVNGLCLRLTDGRRGGVRLNIEATGAIKRPAGPSTTPRPRAMSRPTILANGPSLGDNVN
jgi:hypothetical protein